SLSSSDSTRSLPTSISSPRTVAPSSSFTTPIGICSVWPYGSQFASILNQAYSEGRMASPPINIKTPQFLPMFFISNLKISHIFFTVYHPILCNMVDYNSNNDKFHAFAHSYV